MIFVDVRGNVGNQLFQYALAQRIQKINGQKIIFSTYYIKKYSKKYGIQFSLDEFITNKKNVSVSEEKPNLLYRILMQFGRILGRISNVKGKGRIDYFIFKILSYFGIYIWLKEFFVNIKISEHKNYYLCGYWQSEKYFQDISNELRNEILNTFVVHKKNKDLLKVIKTSNSVCVTIRRGDYVNNEKFKKIYYICDEAYFRNAIKMLQEKTNNLSLIIFSDDIDWARKNIKVNLPTYFESGKDSLSQKLLLMSSCKHFILSNSSFSWWAEFLSKSSKKIVIAPEKWYSDNRRVDIWRENWLLLGKKGDMID